MANQDRIAQLQEKLNILLKKQQHFSIELQELHQEITQLKNAKKQVDPTFEKLKEKTTPVATSFDTKESMATIPSKTENKITQQASANVPATEKTNQKNDTTQEKTNLEKFIGENLINKIGIAILVIGVGIGAKYSIENNLISPLTRIILGYLMGLGLIGFGIKLKAKYENYSAVLVSGALAILYFITFAAYSFYGLFTQLPAFGLMLLFTAFGIVAALNYNKQVIAHIGLVGAYAVPYLLSNNTGNIVAFFSYVAIINIAILIIAFKKYWKPLYYLAFIFTWLIYSSFIAFKYTAETHFAIALIFLGVFFLIFYGIFLAYKLKANEKFKKSDVVLLLLNSFLFYGFGYGLLANHDIGKELLGIFTLCNALIHFIVSAIIYKKKLGDRNLFYLAAGLVLTFITITIPVQLDGNWVTLLWALEAALLFWIGSTKKVPTYKHLSYPLMILAFLSLLEDWDNYYSGYYHEEHMASILNIAFLSSIIFTVAFGWINRIQLKHNIATDTKNPSLFTRFMSFAIPVTCILSLYGAFYHEIAYYFDKLYQLSKIPASIGDEYGYAQYDYQLHDFSAIWRLNYTLLFISLLAFVATKKIKNSILGIVILITGLVAIVIFLVGGLYLLSELRQNFLTSTESPYTSSNFNIIIRYISLGFFALLLASLYKLSKAAFLRINFQIPFEILLHMSLLWVLSSELLNWMDITGSNQSDKLGLSILWGMYSLLLIAVGIYKNKKYLRIAAIALFGITLVKLFFYDIATMNTITKTIVFVSLGILLLIISFLYNKYKHKITDEDKD